MELSLSIFQDQVFSVRVKSGDRKGQDMSETLCASRKVSTRRATCGHALSCLKMALGRSRKQGKTKDIRCQNNINLLSNYRRSELDT